MKCRTRSPNPQTLPTRLNKPFYRNPPRGAPKSSARQRVLAQWRGLDATPIEKGQTNSAKKAGAFLSQVMSRMGLERKRDEAEIGKVWNALIDPTLTAHAQPTGIRNGTLFVTVDNSVWLDEIVRYRRKEIIARMQSSFGKETIAKISFRVG